MENNNPLSIRFEEFLIDMGFANTSETTEIFLRYHDLLREWNSRINLISPNTADDIFERHFLDSISIALVNRIGLHDLDTNLINVLDIGTGAGFPGLPLKIIYPEWKLTLLDSTVKKIDFLKVVSSDLALTNVNFISDRAETVAHMESYRSKFDLVVARAVADLKILAEFMLPFCKMGGSIIAMKGDKAEEEIENALYAIDLLGGGDLKLIDCTKYHPFLKGSLVFISKIAETPENYPRRAGVPYKRPLTDLS